MRFLFSVFVALVVSLSTFAIIKMWGQSQIFIDYSHPFVSANQTPVRFYKPQSGWSVDELKKSDHLNYYFDFAVTKDEVTVVLRKPIDRVRAKLFEEISADVYTAEQIKNFVSGKKVIFNFTENPIAGPELIISFIEAIDFSKTRNFLIISPLEIPLKFLKEKMPAYLYGSSQPEILKMKAMESLGLVEASVFRADVVIYPLDFYHRDFFTKTLVAELNRRYKKYIIGPMTTEEFSKNIDRISEKQPFGIILQD
jgi:hypothetical protein